MTTKKKTAAKPSQTTDTRGLVLARAAALTDSYAASRVKVGWSFSAEMDLLWAAGWPYPLLIDEQPSSDPAGAEALFTGALYAGSPRYSRAALWGYHRVLRDGEWAAQGQLTDASIAAFANGTRFEDAEVQALITHHLHPVRSNGPTGRLVPSALASLTSPRLVVDAMLDATEQWSDETFNEWGVGSCTLLHQLGFVIEWLSPEEHSTALQRLRALRDRADSLWPFAPHERDTLRELGWHLATLELLVGGDQAALARGAQYEGNLQPAALDFVTTPRLVVDACRGFPTGKYGWIHARALWLGGEPVLRWYCANWKRFTAPDAHARFVHILGEVRSPLVTECLLAMTAESKAKKLARQWFDSHSDFARETLPSLTAGPHAALAAKILDELS